MSDRWGKDPTLQLWERWRRPVLVVVTLIFVAGRWRYFASGELLPILTGVGIAAYFVGVIWMRSAPPPEVRSEPTAWRRHFLTSATFHGTFFGLGCLWLALLAGSQDVPAKALVLPAIPGVLLVITLASLRLVPRIAAQHQRISTSGAP
jgi:hypothetical protein